MATAKQFVEACAAEVGNGPEKYNTGGLPWCAIWVNNRLKAVGDSRQGTAAACSFAKMGTLHKSGDGYTPKPGDLLIVNLKADKSWADHVAVVESFSDGTISSLNGNGTGNKVTRSARTYGSSITIVEMTWDGDSASYSSAKSVPKIFLNPGHGKQQNGVYDSGACGNGYIEAELSREVIRAVESNLVGYADVTVWDYERDLFSYINSLNIKWSDYNCFLSVHFDAGGGSGTTVYRAKNRKASALETSLASAVSSAAGFKNNGVKEHPSNLKVLSCSDKAQNGGTSSSLLEVCFIDSASDMNKYAEKKADIAKAISNTLIKELNLTYGGGGGWVADWREMALPNNARALKAKTYERYFKITDASTKNYQISRGENASTHRTKLRLWKNSFLIIALGSFYGPCGTFVKIKFDNGTEIVCIKGDEKDDRETNTDYPAHSYHTDGPGYVEDKSVSCNLLEIEADIESSDWQSGFAAALNEYTGTKTYEAAITNIWISDVEPAWRGGGAGSIANFVDSNEKLPIHNTIFRMPDVIPDDEISVYAELRNITASVGAVSWSNTEKELATTMTFTSAKSDTRYQDVYIPTKGEIIRLFTRSKADIREVFRGIVISDDTGNRHESSYTTADVGWYLNKTTDTYQFKGIPAIEAVKKILSDLSIPIAYLDPVTFEGCYVTEIYIDKPTSEIIWDILENKVGGSWNFDFVPTGIRIYKIGAFEVMPKFRMSDNTELKDSVKHRGAESVTSSIEDMKTAVKVISDKTVLSVARSTDSVNRYGFLQEVIKLEDESANPSDFAQTKLWELNREKATRGFTMQVELTDYTRAGDVITVDDTKYKITSAQHEIKKARHSVTVELERIEIQ